MEPNESRSWITGSSRGQIEPGLVPRSTRAPAKTDGREQWRHCFPEGSWGLGGVSIGFGVGDPAVSAGSCPSAGRTWRRMRQPAVESYGLKILCGIGMAVSAENE